MEGKIDWVFVVALRGLYAVAESARENALHAGWLLLASEVNYWLFA
jgi:hypothetical protein